MPDPSSAPIQNVLEWLVVASFCAGATIIGILLTKTIPSAFTKADALADKLERSQKESTKELVEALERLGDKVEASSHVR